MNLGTALFYRSRYEEAAAAFESATALAPADPMTWGNLGNARKHSPGLRERAPEALERAIGLMRERLAGSSGDAEGWVYLSGWLPILDRNAEAREAAERAISIAPQAPSVLAEAGHTMIGIGDPDRAFELFRAAVRHGYPVELLRHSPDLAEWRQDPRMTALLAPSSGDPPATQRDGG
jgi:cytochrome c-type biogenesis protein CcmH/NrfG